MHDSGLYNIVHFEKKLNIKHGNFDNSGLLAIVTVEIHEYHYYNTN